MSKKVVAMCFLCVYAVFACLSTAAYAEEQQNKFKNFMKGVSQWPMSFTKKSSEAVGNTAKSGIQTVTKTSTSAVKTVTGQPEEIKNVVTEPVVGTVETAKTAVEDTVSAPVEATQEAFEN